MVHLTERKREKLIESLRQMGDPTSLSYNDGWAWSAITHDYTTEQITEAKAELKRRDGVK